MEVKRQVRVFVSRIIVGACFVVGTCLAFAYLLPTDLHGRSEAYVIASALAFGCRLFQFHLGLLCLFAAAVAMLIRSYRTAAVAALIALVAAGPLLAGAIPRVRPAAVQPAFRILNLNLDWDNQNGETLVQIIERVDADVIAFEEFTYGDADVMAHKLTTKYPHNEITGRDAWVACFSKASIGISASDGRVVGKGTLVPGVTRGHAMRVELTIGKRNVALYVVHLKRPDSVETFIANRQEVMTLVAFINKDPLPVLLVGKMNFGQWTPNAFALLNAGLHDAHWEGGWGLAHTKTATQPVLTHLPGLRIDHLYLQRPLLCRKLWIDADSGSDHRAVVAEIGFTDEQQSSWWWYYLAVDSVVCSIIAAAGTVLLFIAMPGRKQHPLRNTVWVVIIMSAAAAILAHLQMPTGSTAMSITRLAAHEIGVLAIAACRLQRIRSGRAKGSAP